MEIRERPLSFQQEFLQACEKQDLEKIIFMLMTGRADVNDSSPLRRDVYRENYRFIDITGDEKNLSGGTPLFKAIVWVHPEVVDILLRHGARLTQIHKDFYCSALWMVLSLKNRTAEQKHQSLLQDELEVEKEAEFYHFFKEFIDHRAEYTEELIQRVHKFESKDAENEISYKKITDMILKRGMSSRVKIEADYFKLCNAILKNDPEAIKSLLSRAKDVEFKIYGAESPLEIALLSNQLQLVEILLEHGADPNQSLNLSCGESILMHAVITRNLELAQLLLKHKARVNVEPEEGVLPHLAMLLKHYRFLNANVETKNMQGGAPLFRAIVTAQPEMVGVLLAEGAKITGLGPFSNCGALEVIISWKFRASLDSNQSDLLEKYEEIEEMIIQRGVSSQNKMEADYFALCDAIRKDDHQAVLDLVNRVEDVNFKEVRAESPLAIAVRLDRWDIIDFLLSRGANPNQDLAIQRESVLFIAIDKECLTMVRMLLRAMANINFEAVYYISDHDLQWTPVFAATMFDNPEIRIELNEMLHRWGVDQTDGTVAPPLDT